MPTLTSHSQPLFGIRVVSLALNLPGPATLLRCHRMGAQCLKVEPPGGDPMASYSPDAYRDLHAGVRVEHLDLKTDVGKRQLEAWLAEADLLITSFRPSALSKLGLEWHELSRRHPLLCQIAIVGAHGEHAEKPGHDLTYLAENGLVTGTEMPATLYADMAGSLLASEAILQALRLREFSQGPCRSGVCLEVALGSAVEWLAQPRGWGLTARAGVVGGFHAGYKVYRCADGRVAFAALEAHFAERLCAAAKIDSDDMESPETHHALSSWARRMTCVELDDLAARFGLPLATMPDEPASPCQAGLDTEHPKRFGA